MKKILTLLLSISSIFVYATQDEIMWQSAYEGDYAVTNTILLSRENKSINDDLLEIFLMGYVCYRLGCDEDAQLVFKVVDQYLEETLSPARE